MYTNTEIFRMFHNMIIQLGNPLDKQSSADPESFSVEVYIEADRKLTRVFYHYGWDSYWFEHTVYDDDDNQIKHDVWKGITEQFPDDVYKMMARVLMYGKWSRLKPEHWGVNNPFIS